MPLPYQDYRCRGCRKLLFRGFVVESEIEIKCRSCGEFNTIAASRFDPMLCAVLPCPHRVAPAAALSNKS